MRTFHFFSVRHRLQKMTLISYSRCLFKENPTFLLHWKRCIQESSARHPQLMTEAYCFWSRCNKQSIEEEAYGACVCVCDGLSTCKQAGCSLAGWLSDTCFLCSLTQARCRLTSQTTARTLSDTSGSTENQSLCTINPEQRGGSFKYRTRP